MIGGITTASLGTAAYMVTTRNDSNNQHNDLLIQPQSPSISSPNQCDNQLIKTTRIDKMSAKLMPTVIKPGIEPYSLSTKHTKNHATKEEVDEITDMNQYADKYPIIPLSEVREHYSPDVGDGTVWVTWKGGVYDVTQFMDHHPGLYVYRFFIICKYVILI